MLDFGPGIALGLVSASVTSLRPLRALRETSSRAHLNQALLTFDLQQKGSRKEKDR
jgi:hypothetical protein